MMAERNGLPARRAGAGRALARRGPAGLALPEGSARPVPSGESGGRGDRDFLPAALEIVDRPPSPIGRQVVCVLAAMVVAAFAWSFFGRLSVYATAAGRIQATGRTKVLEAEAAGQVAALLAKNGDRVKAGDVLVELDPTNARADRTIIADKLADLRAESVRWRAEVAAARADPVVTDPPLAWTDDVPGPVRAREEGLLRANLSELAATLASLSSQRRAKEATRDRYAASITAQKALVAVTSENSGMAATLQEKGWNSKAKLLDLTANLRGQQVALTSLEGSLSDAEAAIAVVDSTIAKTREAFVTNDTQQLATAERQIADLEQQLTKADRTLANMTLRAPVTGVVHASALTTIGQAIKPGQQLLEIVPEGSALEIQAYAQNTDIGFIHVGQAATIKLDTFNYGTYGSIPGTVVLVARDSLSTSSKSTLQDASLDGTFKQSTVAQKTGGLLFPITIRALRPTITIDGQEVALAPGMSVSVEIETERRRAIDYIVSPLMELFSTAGHER